VFNHGLHFRLTRGIASVVQFDQYRHSLSIYREAGNLAAFFAAKQTAKRRTLGAGISLAVVLLHYLNSLFSARAMSKNTHEPATTAFSGQQEMQV
jgi:hypothetical protein